MSREAELAEYERNQELSGGESEDEGTESDERRGGGGRRPSSRPRRGDSRRRGKVCQFCVEKTNAIDYKDVPLLRQLVSERGRILPRRRTGTCARHQRMVSQAVKRARHMALLPYTGEHVRQTH